MSLPSAQHSIQSRMGKNRYHDNRLLEAAKTGEGVWIMRDEKHLRDLDVPRGVKNFQT